MNTTHEAVPRLEAAQEFETAARRLLLRHRVRVVAAAAASLVCTPIVGGFASDLFLDYVWNSDNEEADNQCSTSAYDDDTVVEELEIGGTRVRFHSLKAQNDYDKCINKFNAEQSDELNRGALIAGPAALLLAGASVVWGNASQRYQERLVDLTTSFIPSSHQDDTQSVGNTTENF